MRFQKKRYNFKPLINYGDVVYCKLMSSTLLKRNKKENPKKGIVMMRNLRILLIFCVFLIPSLLSGRPAECRTLQVNAGPTFNFARYQFGCLPKMEGYLAGVHFDFEHGHPSNWYLGLRFDGRWNAGFVCGCQDLKSEIKDYRTEFDLGYRFSKCNIRSFTPFAGIGFYYLSNEFEPQEIAYRYFNVFVPVGFKSEWLVNDCFKWGLNFEYRIDAWTRMKLDSPCIQICDKIKLNRTQGLLLEVPLTWKFGECSCVDYQVKVVPLFDWNRFGRADEANENGLCIEIQKLNQWYLGLHVDLGIRF